MLLSIFADSARKRDVSNASKKISQGTNKLDLVINVVGYLHNAEHWPEKVYVRLMPTSWKSWLYSRVVMNLKRLEKSGFMNKHPYPHPKHIYPRKTV